MAEGQSIKDRNYSEAPLDEEDPLMELSRIIGLEPHRESAPMRTEAAPVFHSEPMDVVEAAELSLQPELAADMQKDLADELIARLEADSEFTLGSAADLEPAAAELVEEVPTVEPVASLEAPVEDYAPVTPHIAVSTAAPVSIEDELEAILNPSMPRATPFGLRPVVEDVTPVEMRAPEIDSHLDMNFDAQPLEAESAKTEWAADGPAEFEPISEAEPEIADEHYEAVERYEAEEAPLRAWPPMTSALEPEIAELRASVGDTQPILETVAHESRAIEATDEFEIPEFEYGNVDAPAAADDPLSGFDNNFESQDFQRAAVSADHAAPTAHDFGDHRFSEADFDQINDAVAELEDKQSNIGATIAAAGIGAAAASAGSGRKEFVLNQHDDQFTASLDVPSAPRSVPRQSAMRGYLTAAALGTLALVGGIAAYAWTRGPDPSAATSAPVVLKADVEPVKVAPENPGGKVVPNQDIAVYDKVAGAEQPTGEPQKVLVSKVEAPVDLAEKAATRVVLPGPAATETDAATAVGEVAKAEDRAPVDTAEDVSAAQSEIASVAAKKVRTMVVKSDGSLVERPVEEAKPIEVASTEPRVEEEDLLKSMADASIPATKVQTTQIVAQQEVGAVAKPVAPVAEAAAAVDAPVVEPEQAPETVAVAEPEVAAKPVVKAVKTKKITQKKPAQEQTREVAAAANIPLVDARPSDQPVTIVAKTGKTPSAEALAEVANAVVAAPAPSAGGYVIQIASAPSSDQAQSTYASLNRKFGKVIGGRDMNIQKADIPGKGTFYRVRIAAGSKKEAAALCAKYKSVGGQCLVAR